MKADDWTPEGVQRRCHQRRAWLEFSNDAFRAGLAGDTRAPDVLATALARTRLFSVAMGQRLVGLHYRRGVHAARLERALEGCDAD